MSRPDASAPSATDVAELHAQVAALREALRRAEGFAANVAHDLAAPLRSVHGFLALAEKRHSGAMSPELAELVAEARRGAERLRVTVDGHLTLMREQDEHVGLGPVSLDDVVAGAAAGLVDAIRRGRATIHAEPLPVVWGHAGLLHILVQNLIANSLRYRGDALPVIAIGADRQGDHWQVVVRDNGIGLGGAIDNGSAGDATTFAPDELHPLERREGGLGIGLQTCAAIVSRLGGRMWLQSPEGGGTCVYFTLAALAGEGAHDPTQDAS